MKRYIIIYWAWHGWEFTHVYGYKNAVRTYREYGKIYGANNVQMAQIIHDGEEI